LIGLTFLRNVLAAYIFRVTKIITAAYTETISDTMKATVEHFCELPEQTQCTTQCKNTTDDHHSVVSLNMNVINKKDNFMFC